MHEHVVGAFIERGVVWRGVDGIEARMEHLAREPPVTSHAYLPGVLAEIADVAGLPAALAIAERCGGARQYFPARAVEGHWLVQCVGREAADKLCRHFHTTESGGIELMVPHGPAGTRAGLHRLLQEKLAAGVSAEQCARDLGIDRTTVFRNKKPGKLSGNPAQGKLL